MKRCSAVGITMQSTFLFTVRLTLRGAATVASSIILVALNPFHRGMQNGTSFRASRARHGPRRPRERMHACLRWPRLRLREREALHARTYRHRRLVHLYPSGDATDVRLTLQNSTLLLSTGSPFAPLAVTSLP